MYQVARLVHEKKMEPKQAIRELLNYTPSVSLAAFPIAVHVITELLFDHFITSSTAQEAEGVIAEEFYTHPYVTLLIQRPDAWQHLLHAFVDRLIKEDAATVLKAFSSWISYVLLNPQLSIAITAPSGGAAQLMPIFLRSQLHAQLVRVGAASEDKAVSLYIFAELTSFLPFYRYVPAAFQVQAC